MKIIRFSELGEDVRDTMAGARWILLDQDDIQHALSALMFAELDGTLIGIDHRGSEFKSGIHNRAIHLLLVDEDNGITGITKVVTEGELEDYLW